MILKERIEAFVQTGLFISRHYGQRLEAENQLHQGLEQVINLSFLHNGWFSPNFVNTAIQNIGLMLTREQLHELCGDRQVANPKTVALICAGNIPMAGFHDLMCILLSGNKALLKLSSDDNVLLPFFLKLLVHYEPRLEEQITFAGAKLSNFDAVIATGSNNTARHFEFYFNKYPRVIRKNRSSVGILTGKESADDLKNLGQDIFLYYGLGCRNVSKVMVPAGYDFKNFFEAILPYGYVIDNKKYANNYDYHRALYLLEKFQFLDNNFLIVMENDQLHSPVSVLYYQQYKHETEVKNYLDSHREQIQCVVGEGYIPFGYSQRPVITDFADDFNTWEFLVTL